MSFKVQSYIILFFKEIDNKLQNIFRHSMKECIATNQIKIIICLRRKKRAEMRKMKTLYPANRWQIKSMVITCSRSRKTIRHKRKIILEINTNIQVSCGQRNTSMVESTQCSCGLLEFGCEHPYCVNSHLQLQLQGI